MNKKQMQTRILEDLRKLENVARNELGVVIPVYNVIFDLKGLTAGWAISNKDKTYDLRFNLDIALNNEEEFYTTVVHEFAHIITDEKYPKAKQHHGREWKYVMQKLGIANPKRCHSYKNVVQARKTRKFEAVCSCNINHVVGVVAYNRSVKYKQEKDRDLYRCSRCYSGLEFKEIF